MASFAEIRKGLVSFPLINNILAKILREGSNLAKCNAALAIKGMALDAGFRADALACVLHNNNFTCFTTTISRAAPDESNVLCERNWAEFSAHIFVPCRDCSGAGTAWRST